MLLRVPSRLLICSIAIVGTVILVTQDEAVSQDFLGSTQVAGQDTSRVWKENPQSSPPRARDRRRLLHQHGAIPGSGTLFANAVTYDSGGAGAWAIAVADVNGDGKPDLMVANATATGPAGVSVLLGNGDGTFQPALPYNSFGAQTTIALGDINGDGAPDIVLANLQGPTVVVLLGNGNGTFQDPTAFSTGSGAITSMSLGDVNRDGKLDLIVGNSCTANCTGVYNDSVGVLLGRGDGTFQNMASYALGTDGVVGPSSIVASDVNGDGKVDLVVADRCGEAPVCTPDGFEGAVSVLLGKGDGTFQPATVYASGDEDATSVAVGDVNGDGKPDIVVSNMCVDTLDDCFPAADDVGVLLGKGDGTFQNALTYNAGGLTATSVAIADIDGDGAPDIIVANQCGPSLDSCVNDSLLGVLAGNGDGTFQSPVIYDTGGNSANGIAVTDINGDGRPDVLIANACATSACTGNGLIGVLLNTGISFGLVPNPATVNISGAGQSGSTTITIFANGGLNPQSLSNWTCSGLPQGSACSFGTIDASNQISLTITTAASADLRRPLGRPHRLFYASLLLGFFGLVSISKRGRARNLHLLTLIGVLFLAAMWASCGGGSNTGGGGGGGGGTTVGTYPVIVSATSGALKPSTAITLNVQ